MSYNLHQRMSIILLLCLILLCLFLPLIPSTFAARDLVSPTFEGPLQQTQSQTHNINNSNDKDLKDKKARSVKMQDILDTLGKNCTRSSDCLQNRLVCSEESHRCETCLHNDECFPRPAYACQPTTLQFTDDTESVLQVCREKSLFPLSWNDILASGACWVGSVVASSAGIGGGGLFNPLLMLSQFPTDMAVPMATAIIFGASTMSTGIFLFKEHPTAKSRPVIDYGLILLTQPITLCGTTIGVILNIIFPAWLIVLLLFILLMSSSVRSFRKGLSLRKADIAKRQAKVIDQLHDFNDEDSNFDLGYDHDDNTSLCLSDGMRDAKDDNLIDVELQQFDDRDQEEHDDSMSDNDSLVLGDVVHGEQTPGNEDSKDKKSLQSYLSWFRNNFTLDRLPIHLMIAVVLEWVIVFAFNVVKGSRSLPSIIGVEQCDPWYWLIVVSSLVVMYLCSAFFGIYLRIDYRKKLKNAHEFIQGDVHYNNKNAFALPLLFFFVGFAGALVGIGGGMLSNPLMLDIGVLPEVTVATSTVMLLLTASSAMVQYVVAGRLQFDYMLWCIGLGVTSAILGQLGIGRLVKRLGRPYILVFIVTSVIFVSAVGMSGVGVFNTVMDVIYQRYSSLFFSNLC